MTPVAVVIPCRNLGRTLGDAISSVERQTRPAQELVVVDDGSDDLFTCETLHTLEQRGYRVVRTESRGLAAARNSGIRATSAPYLVALDADDELMPRYLDVVAGSLDADAALGFAATGVAAFGGADWTWTPPPCDLLNAFARGGRPQSAIFRRRLWDTIGGYDEALPLYEDFDFWVRAMAAGFRGRIFDEPLLRYRVRPESIHHQAVRNGSHFRGMQVIHQKHRRTIESLGLPLLLEKERFLEEQRGHVHELSRRKRDALDALSAVNEEIAQLQTQLAATRTPALSLGDLRRLTPLSDRWGLDRGKPVDRYYIEQFLERHAADIRGRVIEVKDAAYTRRFGGAAVTHIDVLDVSPGNTAATVIADLSQPHALASSAYDCIVLTQTLHLIFDTRAALANLARSLRPGGVLLCTVPSVSRVSFEDGGIDRDYWRFTEASLRQLLAADFASHSTAITAFGNVLVCAAFLYGLSPTELTLDELEYHDPYFPLVFGVRAVKS